MEEERKKRGPGNAGRVKKARAKKNYALKGKKRGRKPSRVQQLYTTMSCYITISMHTPWFQTLYTTMSLYTMLSV